MATRHEQDPDSARDTRPDPTTQNDHLKFAEIEAGLKSDNIGVARKALATLIDLVAAGAAPVSMLAIARSTKISWEIRKKAVKRVVEEPPAIGLPILAHFTNSGYHEVQTVMRDYMSAVVEDSYASEAVLGEILEILNQMNRPDTVTDATRKKNNIAIARCRAVMDARMAGKLNAQPADPDATTRSAPMDEKRTMAPRLTLQDRDWLIKRLATLPEMLTPQSQNQFIRSAFYGSPRVDDIATRMRYSNTPRTFVLDLLGTFGDTIQQDVPGRYTMAAVLSEALNCVGEGDDANTLRRLLAVYTPAIPPDSHAEPAPAHVPSGDDTMTPASELVDVLAAMPPDRRTELNLLLYAVSLSGQAAREAQQSADELRAWAGAALDEARTTNDALRKQLAALTEPQSNASGYLQLSLPLIPGILSYNSELGTERALNLRDIWTRIRGRFRGDAKGGAGGVRTRAVVNSGKARAVFVGVSTYDDGSISRLNYSAGDMVALHRLLARRYAGAALLASDQQGKAPVRNEVLKQLRAQAEAAEAGDLLLFCFSGHGVAANGDVCLLVKDSAWIEPLDTSVRLDKVLETMRASAARAKVLILDACHAGAQIGKSRSTLGPDFENLVHKQAQGLCILASSRHDQVSWEAGEYGHGIFTHFFIEALSGRADFEGKGYVTVTDAHKYVSAMVKHWAAASGRAQSPTLQCEIEGDIVLHRYS